MRIVSILLICIMLFGCTRSTAKYEIDNIAKVEINIEEQALKRGNMGFDQTITFYDNENTTRSIYNTSFVYEDATKQESRLNSFGSWIMVGINAVVTFITLKLS